LTDPLSFPMQYTNLGTTTWNITRRFVARDLSYHNISDTIKGGSENIYAFETISYPRLFDYTFESNWDDSAKFSMENYLITDFDDSTHYLRWNDTVRYTQQFFNYYAYDDGSAENGYGLYGEGSQDGMVAAKYHSYESDSLKGILIYFNQIYTYSKTWFYLTVWSDDNGKPGDILYQKYTLKPALTNSYNKDSLYKIEIPLKIGGDFWVGTDKLYYNLTGEWLQSQFEGSLMIKPVFGKFAQGQTGIDTPIKRTEFTLYPNPASNQINLNLSEGVQPEMIRIYNLSGQLILSQAYQSNNIDISSIPTGIYLFQLTLHNRTTATKKLVIIK